MSVAELVAVLVAVLAVKDCNQRIAVLRIAINGLQSKALQSTDCNLMIAIKVLQSKDCNMRIAI